MTTYIPKDSVAQKLGTNAGVISTQDAYDLTLKINIKKAIRITDTSTVSSVANHDLTVQHTYFRLWYSFYYIYELCSKRFKPICWILLLVVLLIQQVL